MFGSGFTPYIPDFPMPQRNEQVTIYYLKWCPACGRALDALKKFRDKKGNPLLYVAYDAEALMANLLRQAGYSEINEELLSSKGRQLLFKKIDRLTGKYRYFPMIFMRGKFIGGSTDLIEVLTQLAREK